MWISQEQFEQAMQTVNLQIQTLDRALNARIAFAEAEVLRLRSLRDSDTQQAKSGIMDARKIYPQKLKDMARWRPWTERVIRWAKMQSTDLAAALIQALKARDAPVTHSCAEESTYFWAHLEDWVEESEAAGIIRLVRDDDGIEAFRQLSERHKRGG